MWLDQRLTRGLEVLATWFYILVCACFGLLFAYLAWDIWTDSREEMLRKMRPEEKEPKMDWTLFGTVWLSPVMAVFLLSGAWSMWREQVQRVKADFPLVWRCPHCGRKNERVGRNKTAMIRSPIGSWHRCSHCQNLCRKTVPPPPGTVDV